MYLLHQECNALCQKSQDALVLRGLEPHELSSLSLNFNKLVNEWANISLFLKFLFAVASVYLSNTESNAMTSYTAGVVLL